MKWSEFIKDIFRPSPPSGLCPRPKDEDDDKLQPKGITGWIKVLFWLIVIALIFWLIAHFIGHIEIEPGDYWPRA